ncbi:hypothetical protein [Mycoplasmopsis arginini]|uniref:hypothetical protein n=1 Tax=Mycoplasmopsis arginini TaxID=2094 RepID=UPI002735A9EF|nr:hypothetical protein [Mycoplasmopsis arginini]MDP4042901.1 hypothetical protein [Mycoplasmopsis arginini]
MSNNEFNGNALDEDFSYDKSKSFEFQKKQHHEKVQQAILEVKDLISESKNSLPLISFILNSALKTYFRFNLINTIFLNNQLATVSDVRTKREWEKMGGEVIDVDNPLQIISSFATNKDNNIFDNFKIQKVYDISQTSLFDQNLLENHIRDFYEKNYLIDEFFLNFFIKKLETLKKIKVEELDFQDFFRSLNKYSKFGNLKAVHSLNTKTIWINKSLDLQEKFKSITHEYLHLVNQDDYDKLTNGKNELIINLTEYIILSVLNIETNINFINEITNLEINDNFKDYYEILNSAIRLSKDTYDFFQEVFQNFLSQREKIIARFKLRSK